jgi:hypothetical protein
MAYALFVIAALNVLGIYRSIASIGAPRQPTTPSNAATAVLVTAGIITVEVLAGIALLHH